MSEWKLTSAAVTGLSHLMENTPCQDKYCVSPQESGRTYHAAALADGVGSLANSHIAAILATDTALAWMIECRDRLFSESRSSVLEKRRQKELAAQMLTRIRSVITEHAQQHSIELQSMDCNLAFCFVDEAYGKAFVGQLGDCAVCVIGDDTGERRSFVMNDPGLLANSTDTIMSRGSEERVNIDIIPLMEKNRDGVMVDNWVYGFILTSDGLENVLYRKGSRCVCKQAEYCFNLDAATDDKRSERLRELLNDAQKSSRGYLDDDMSIVVLSRANGPIELPEEPHWVCSKCGTRNLVTENLCHSCRADMLTMYSKADIDRAGGVDAYFELQMRLAQTPSAEELNNRAAGNEAKKTAQKDMRKKSTQSMAAGTIDIADENSEIEESKSSEPPSLSSIGKILAPNDAPTDENVHLQSGNGRSGRVRPRGDPPEDIQRTDWVTKILLAFLTFLIVLLLAVFIVGGTHFLEILSGQSGTEPSGNEIQSTGPSDSENHGDPLDPLRPSGEGVRLDDGSLFFGRVADGHPEGFGSLIRSDTVWTGYFTSGVKNGLFTITTIQDQKVAATVVFYENDRITQTYYGETESVEERICVMKYKTRLYATADYDGDPVRDDNGNIVYVQPDEQVYPTGEEYQSGNDIMWSKIRTESGIVGWVEDSAIIRTGSSDTFIGTGIDDTP